VHRPAPRRRHPESPIRTRRRCRSGSSSGSCPSAVCPPRSSEPGSPDGGARWTGASCSCSTSCSPESSGSESRRRWSCGRWPRWPSSLRRCSPSARWATGPVGRVPGAHPREGAPDRRRIAALPLLPRLAARGSTGIAGRARRVAGGVEVGRDPRTARPPSGPRLPLVARRGARHRALPRGGRGRRDAPRGNRPGWRGAGLRRGPAAAVRAPPDPHRPADADPEDPRAGSGGVHGLRRARARGAGHPRPAAVRAPRAAGGAARRTAPPLLRLRGALRADLGGPRRAGGSRPASARWRG
jgi:hypothetical protein